MVNLWDVITSNEQPSDFILTKSSGSGSSHSQGSGSQGQRGGGKEGKGKDKGKDGGRITCIQYSPDGERIVAGTLSGEVTAYYCIPRPHDNKYELKYWTKFFCRDRKGRYSHGEKVTGLQFIQTTRANLQNGDIGIGMGKGNNASGLGIGLGLGDNGNKGIGPGLGQTGIGQTRSGLTDEYMLLVTTNDHNVRMMDWASKTTYTKFKGGLNESLQIAASASTCLSCILC